MTLLFPTRRRAPARSPLTAALMAIAAGTLAWTAGTAGAQLQPPAANTIAFNIPAQALAPALAEFARQSGLQLVYSPELVQGRRSSAVLLRKDAPSALAELLQGTALQARQVGSTWVIERAAAAGSSSETVLPALRVTAASERETATGPMQGYVARRNETGSKTDTPTREIPQSISVVTRDSLDARGVSSLAEALEYTPGFTGWSYGHDDRYDWSIARGIGETYSTNFRDGLKEAGSVYAVPRLSTYGVERVDYLRGPASLLFGSNIPGGAVNSITKRPTREPQGEIRLRGGDISRFGIAADMSGPVDAGSGVLYRVVALQERYELPTPGAKKEERYFAPALSLPLSPNTELTLLANIGYDRIEGDAYPYSYYEPVAPVYIRVAEKDWDRFDRRQQAAGYLLEHRFNDSTRFHSRGRYSKIKLDYRVNFAYDFVSSTVVDRYAQRIQDDATVWQTDNYIETQWHLNGWSNTTIAGIDLSKVKSAEYRGGDLTSPYDTATGRGIGAFIEPPMSPAYIANTRQSGLYLQNQAKFDERFVVVLGGRKDWHRVDNSTSGATLAERSNAFTGRIGGVWLAPGGWSPYVSYATSFQPQAGVDANGGRFKPTSGRQYEIGLRYEPAGKNALLSAAVFDIVQHNVLTADPLNRNFSIQRGEIGSRGLELEANASLSGALDLAASYSYTNARVTQDTDPTLVGLKNGSVPAHKATAWLNYRLPAAWLPGLKLGFGIRHNSRVPDAENIRWVPGVTLVDARVGYQIEPHWEFAVNLRNLFDKKHLVNCSYGSCYPGDEREIVATAIYRW